MMITDHARALTLDIVKAIIAQKRLCGRRPDYALLPEIRQAMTEVTDVILQSLSADGLLTPRVAGVNRIPAYSIPSTLSENENNRP